MDDCFTCRVAAGTVTPPGGVLVDDGLAVVNHRCDDRDPLGRARSWPGWLIVSPRRHVVRSFEMTEPERARVFGLAGRIDQALTELYGARRCMVASLGWWVDDHLHVHVVPTWADPTLGWQNFNHPGPDLGVPATEIAAAVGARLG